jgi:hypothetical protein
MQSTTYGWSSARGWSGGAAGDADWVLYFAAPEVDGSELYRELRARHPAARLLGCTTGGEISGNEVSDGSVVAAAVKFDAARVRGASAPIGDQSESCAVGGAIGRSLLGDGLRAIFVLSDGTRVNGTELVRGLRDVVGEAVVITGGLAGDGPRFGATRVGLDEAPVAGRVAAIGLYGDGLTITHGIGGGWVPFGPERIVTHSRGNVLFQLDHRPALALYKTYLGEESAGLPGSALLYPLLIDRPGGGSGSLVRTIVGVDEAAGSMTFAGDIPVGSVARLMRGSLDQLIDGAAVAATSVSGGPTPSLAILVSCIGRKLLMGQRTADEVEAVCDVLGATVPVVGFYSYGEICPGGAGYSDLHNQTMTITTLSEQASS